MTGEKRRGVWFTEPWAPPELPGLIAASVCTQPLISRPPGLQGPGARERWGANRCGKLASRAHIEAAARARGGAARPSTSRPSAETTPVVSVWSRPNGLPIASTVCPTCRSEDEPIGMGGGSAFGAIFSTATSFSGSAPTTVASSASAAPCSFTLTLLPPPDATTW